MQISAPDLGTKDGIVTQYLIKQLSSQMGANSFFSKGPNYRVFTILEADVLSLKAQAGLRRTMEKYSNNSRLILHCEQLSSIIPPLRSRCLCIRVPLPSPEEVLQVLRYISISENLQVPTGYLEQIVTESECNLRRAILILETAYTQSFSMPPSALKLPWQKVCIDIATSVSCPVEFRETLFIHFNSSYHRLSRIRTQKRCWTQGSLSTTCCAAASPLI